MQPRLYWQIHKLAFLLEKKADETLKSQLGIGFAQYKVLEAIGQNAMANQQRIAALLDQTEAGVSRQIKLLSSKKLIDVGVVMGNRRSRELTLTEAGEEVVNHCEALLDIAQAQIFGGLSYQEQRLFAALFDRMLTKARS
jgi:MarR family transcriptional regulator, lower aerobic nicotinate degradation pathway regulator